MTAAPTIELVSPGSNQTGTWLVYPTLHQFDNTTTFNRSDFQERCFLPHQPTTKPNTKKSAPSVSVRIKSQTKTNRQACKVKWIKRPTCQENTAPQAHVQSQTNVSCLRLLSNTTCDPMPILMRRRLIVELPFKNDGRHSIQYKIKNHLV